MFAAAMVLLWIGAGPRELTKTDEHRYITVAREFVVGGDWFVCRLNGEVYTHKPPGVFWAMAASRLLGLGWTQAAILPGTIGAAVAATLVFDLARRLWGRVAAWTSALALITAKEFFTISIRGQIDPFLTLWTTLSVYASARALLSGAEPRARAAWVALAWLSAGFGMLVKGPVSWLMAGAPVLAFLAWQGRADGGPGGSLRAFRTRAWIFAPLAVLPGAAWAVAAAAQESGGWDYVSALAFGQGIGHAAGKVDKLEPWWFYLRALPIGLLPWTLLLPAALAAWKRHSAPERRAPDRFVLAWFLVPVVLMSVSPAKRDLYLLPVYPAAALLLGRLAMTLSADASRLSEPEARWGFRLLGGSGIAAGTVLTTVGAAHLAGSDDWIAGMWRGWEAARVLMPHSAITSAVVLGVLIAATSVATIRARTFRAVAVSVASTMLLLTAASALVYAPFTESWMSPRAFLGTVKARIGAAPLYDYGGTDYAANWICDRTSVPFVWDREVAAQIVRETQGPVYFTIEASRLPKKGMPEGCRVILEDPRHGEFDLVLIGRE